MKVYGASVSYYTGKLEAYLRYKGIAYERANPYQDIKEIIANLGSIQHPMVKRDDGRWMSDSTPMILQLEKEHPERSVIPANPVVRFIAMLIEDYADEWLWRAAMHFRWSYDHDRELLSRILADELTAHIRAPRFMRVRSIRKRQLTGFVVMDGVTEKTWSHVESGYHNILKMMTTALKNRHFLLGDKLSIADIGLMGPMLRHFGQDPTPAEIMRDTAPDVFAWLGRVWNASSSLDEGTLLDCLPDDLAPMLQEICETHLAQLSANATAYHQGEVKFSMTVQGCDYQNLPISRYRVYCLEMLRRQFSELNGTDQDAVKALLPFDHAALIWTDDVKAKSEYDDASEAPFNKSINVFTDGVPS